MWSTINSIRWRHHPGPTSTDLPIEGPENGHQNAQLTGSVVQLADWNALESIAWCLKKFDILPDYAESDEAFSCLSDLKYTRYPAAVLPVAHFQSEDVDEHLIICTYGDPSWKNHSLRNNIVLLWPDWEIKGNIASIRRRIPARLCYLFLVQDSSCVIQAFLALVQTLIPGPKKQPIGMVMVTEKELQFPNRGPLWPDELSVHRRPHTGVGASYLVPLQAVERAAHLCPFSNDLGNRRWFLNSTIIWMHSICRRGSLSLGRSNGMMVWLFWLLFNPKICSAGY